MLSVLQWFIGLGSTVFLPIIIFILGIIFGVKPAKAAVNVPAPTNTGGVAITTEIHAESGVTMEVKSGNGTSTWYS